MIYSIVGERSPRHETASAVSGLAGTQQKMYYCPVEKLEIDEPVHLEKYDDKWPLKYNQEASILQNELKSFSVKLAHFGSTAVPGLLAKPIIDILIGIKSVPPSVEFIQKLKARNYQYLGEAGVRGRHYFCRRASSNFNLAVVQKDGDHWVNNLAIRDYLRSHPEKAETYAKLKEKIVLDGANTLLQYSSMKIEFVKELLQEACKRKDWEAKGRTRASIKPYFDSRMSHFDRGSRYAADEYRKMLTALKITEDMSRKKIATTLFLLRHF